MRTNSAERYFCCTNLNAKRRSIFFGSYTDGYFFRFRSIPDGVRELTTYRAVSQAAITLQVHRNIGMLLKTSCKETKMKSASFMVNELQQYFTMQIS